MSNIKGHISQIIGPVVDVHFEVSAEDASRDLPKIYDALTVLKDDGKELVIEARQHIGEDTVRCVAMDG